MLALVHKIHSPAQGRLAIEIKATPPDKRKRDLDNILKSLLDSLTHARVIEDDSQFDAIAIARLPSSKPGQVEITITQLENL
jgi:crossover junction endodeoxyribonuclease RusA